MDSFFFQEGSQEALKTAESSVASLRKDLEKGQTSHAEVEEKLHLSLTELENTKAGFLKEKKSFEAEKATLLKRAENAESQLKPITEELFGLKRYIAQMTQAIFGPRTSSFYDNSLLMLKVVYSLTEQLYAGSHLAIKATMGDKQPLKFIKNVLECLSTIPQHIPELKRSAARSGAICASSRALAYGEELDPAELAKGFPEFKHDGSEFSQEDYAACVKDAQILSTQLVSEMKLRNYQAAYGANHTRIPSLDLISKSLAPQRREHVFPPEVDPSPILDDKAVFQALSYCNWDADNLQIHEPEDQTVDNPEASHT